MPIDPKGLQILLDLYWGIKGWIDPPQRHMDPRDLAYARRKGLMFAAAKMPHDTVVRRARSIVRRTKRRAVADAFVVSLATHRLDLRSALYSYALLSHLPAHRTPTTEFEGCEVCGVFHGGEMDEDLSELNFERHKWGGVRVDDVLYAMFDLEQFAKLKVEPPNELAVELLWELIDAIRSSPRNTSSAMLHKYLPKSIKGTKAECSSLIGGLGVCGLLETKKHRGHRERFVKFAERPEPPRRFVDMAYPACWWKASDGVSEAAVTHWFGHLRVKQNVAP